MDLGMTNIIHLIMAIFVFILGAFFLFVYLKNELDKRKVKQIQMNNLLEIQHFIKKEIDYFSDQTQKGHVSKDKNSFFVLIYRTLLFLEMDTTDRRYPSGEYKDYLIYLLDNVMRQQKSNFTSTEKDNFDKAHQLISSFIAENFSNKKTCGVNSYCDKNGSGQ